MMLIESHRFISLSGFYTTANFFFGRILVSRCRRRHLRRRQRRPKTDGFRIITLVYVNRNK